MNTLLLVAAIVEGLFAIGFIAVPGPMLGPYGVALDPTSTSFVRLFGSALLTFPVLLSYARASCPCAGPSSPWSRTTRRSSTSPSGWSTSAARTPTPPA